MRREVLAVRDGAPFEDRQRRSRSIAERVASLQEISGLTLLLSYWPMGSEVDPLLLLPLLPIGIALALPRVVGREIVPTAYVPGDPLAPSDLGPREPTLGGPIEPGAIGVVLVPGVAFDPSGSRIGYGGGFYDRFAGALPSGTPRIALAFEFQVLPEVPTGPFDRRVSLIVTEERVIRP